MRNKDGNSINQLIIKNNFNCNLKKGLNNYLSRIDFSGFSNNIHSIKHKNDTSFIRSKKKKLTRKRFQTVILKRVSVFDIKKENKEIDHFSINKTKNTFLDDLEWLYSPINLLSVQEIILHSNNYDFEKNYKPSGEKKRTTLRKKSLSLKNIRKELDSPNNKILRKFSMSKNLFNLKYLSLKQNLKKPTAFNNFSILNQKKFFKRQIQKKYKRQFTRTDIKNNNDDYSSSASFSDRLTSLENETNVESIYYELLSSIIESKNNQFFKCFEKNKKVIDINQKLLEGKNTLLILSAREGNLAISKFLCEKGIQVNLQNSEGNTALHYAIGNQFYSIADILTRFGAREDISNNRGLLPWDCLGNNLD